MQDSALKRFGISMDGSLLQTFDHLVKQMGYENRSEAIIQQLWKDGERLIVGGILLFYDHHKRNLLVKMSKI